MKAFSTALRHGGVLDIRGSGLPGTYVVLPFGVRLIERYAQLVREAYNRAGLEEYDYPCIAPVDNFTPARSILDMNNTLLHVGKDDDFARRRPVATLCPTGEEVIYPHWSRLIRKPADLPLRMYRRTRYYRPAPQGKHSGRSVFRSLEAADVFEFHCAYAGAGECADSVQALYQMLRQLVRLVQVPTLWSTRPPWGNHGELAELAIAGDVPLPTGATVQTACVYNQGQIFSRAYDIRVVESGRSWHPYHAVGCVTRRLLLAHLFLGLDTAGQLTIHPVLAPDQIIVLLQSGAEDNEPAVERFVKLLRAQCLRARAMQVDRQTVNLTRRNNRLSGVPLEVLVQGRRHPEDRFKIVMTRGDTGEERMLLADQLDELVDQCEQVVKHVGWTYCDRAWRYFACRCRQAPTLEVARDILQSRLVAICPLDAGADAVAEVASWKSGEILGFVHGPSCEQCALTNRPTRLLALLSPRV
jgi:prolyl-tRNA synthetase